MQVPAPREAASKTPVPLRAAVATTTTIIEVKLWKKAERALKARGYSDLQILAIASLTGAAAGLIDIYLAYAIYHR